MTFGNFVRSLRSFCHRRPFRPFLVELVSGTVFRVRHPEAVMLQREVVIFTAPDSTQRLFDCTTICQLFDPPPAKLPGHTPTATEEST